MNCRYHRGDRRRHLSQCEADLHGGTAPRRDGRLPGRAGSRQGRADTTCRRFIRWRLSSLGWIPRSTTGWRTSAPTRLLRCAVRPASPTPASPTPPTRKSSSAATGTNRSSPTAPRAVSAMGLDRAEERDWSDILYVTELVAPHREHRAGEDPRRDRRPWPHHRRHRHRPGRRNAGGVRQIGSGRPST